jgi:hypothetical protein
LSVVARTIAIGAAVVGAPLAIGTGVSLVTSDPRPAIIWFSVAAVSVTVAAFVWDDLKMLSRSWRFAITTFVTLGTLVAVHLGDSWVVTKARETSGEKIVTLARESISGAKPRPTKVTLLPRSGAKQTEQSIGGGSNFESERIGLLGDTHDLARNLGELSGPFQHSPDDVVLEKWRDRYFQQTVTVRERFRKLGYIDPTLNKWVQKKNSVGKTQDIGEVSLGLFRLLDRLRTAGPQVAFDVRNSSDVHINNGKTGGGKVVIDRSHNVHVDGVDTEPSDASKPRPD